MTGAPSISRILSPGWRPISCAGRPSNTSSTVVVAFPPADMSTIAKTTTAKARFVAGPAAMATMRFQIGCRQYASSERLSRDVAQPAVDAVRGRRLRAATAEGVELDSRLLEVVRRERALEPFRRADELRRVTDRAAEERVDVGRLRPGHAGDRHVAAERDARNA